MATQRPRAVTCTVSGTTKVTLGPAARRRRPGARACRTCHRQRRERSCPWRASPHQPTSRRAVRATASSESLSADPPSRCGGATARCPLRRCPLRRCPVRCGGCGRRALRVRWLGRSSRRTGASAWMSSGEWLSCCWPASRYPARTLRPATAPRATVAVRARCAWRAPPEASAARGGQPAASARARTTASSGGAFPPARPASPPAAPTDAARARPACRARTTRRADPAAGRASSVIPTRTARTGAVPALPGAPPRTAAGVARAMPVCRAMPPLPAGEVACARRATRAKPVSRTAASRPARRQAVLAAAKATRVSPATRALRAATMARRARAAAPVTAAPPGSASSRPAGR
jgi:hypothetical protein